MSISLLEYNIRELKFFFTGYYSYHLYLLYNMNRVAFLISLNNEAVGNSENEAVGYYAPE